jgi:cell division protein FtsQ
MAERRRAVVRDRGRRRRTTALAAIGALALGMGLWFLATGPVLAVRQVSLTGYGREDAGRLEAAIGLAAGEGTILRPATAAIRDAARAFPWVAGVSISRDWPLGLRVDITEAEAVAAVKAGGNARVLVDGEGRVLGAPTPGRARTDTADAAAATTAGTTSAAAATAGIRPLATERRRPRAGILLRGPAPATGELLAPGLRSALIFVNALEPEVAGRVADLRLEAGRVVGRLEDGPELRLGRPERMVAKALALQVVLDQIPAEDEEAATYLDLSLPERPAVGGLEPLVQEDAPPPAVPPEEDALAPEVSTEG